MNTNSVITRIISSIKSNIFKGLLATIPFVLTIFVIHILYVYIDQRFIKLLDKIIGFSFPGLGIVLLFLILYLVGVIMSYVIGRQMIGLIEKVTNRIPLIKTTYQIGKQLSSAFLLPEKQIFKKAVLVDFLKPGIWTVGFITGTIADTKNNNQKYYKVYIPTPPNPTSGTMVIVKESEIRDPGWSIEEAMKSVISGGIIGPDELR
ncbi:DUF502 domain-containing protein [candidate division KSB1 bacterium]